MTPETPPTENIYGIAKRVSLDLEKLPLHTHAAVVVMVKTMMEHRKIVLEAEMNQKQIDAQEAAMADARKAHAQRQVLEEQRIAAQMLAAEEPKKPRLVIELDTARPPVDAERKFDAATDTGVSVEDALKIVSEPSPAAELVQA